MKTSNYECSLKSFDQERASRIFSRKNNNKECETNFLNWLNKWPDKKIILKGINYFNVAKSIKYSHSKLNTNSYFAHVLRVTEIAMNIRPDIVNNSIGVSLIHNIFETSEYTKDDLLNYFDIATIKTVELLTIDRNKEHMHDYLLDYYENIKFEEAALVVKLADKIDNIFTLCLNNDSDKRERYLYVVEIYLLPLIKTKVPHFYNYLKDLIIDSRQVGFIG